MTLASGTSLGPYEILSPIGAGGMGEVYRAKDTRLNREVAIKVLPERTANDAEALSRFTREAQTVAAISHPNIMAIYDVGTEDDVSFVVTELLEGETLRDHIRGSPIPWRSAVEMGMAICDGMAAAHNKGIIHRDLKPENIFITSEGLVKILDFGLAHIESVTTDQSASETPTITLHTRPGAVMGTIHYMSPEQLRGLKTDARSDIFSMGCVLHEMVTGKRAFAGETDVDTVTAILREQPPNVSKSVVDAPPGLDRVINRCLEKKPTQRIQSARDMGFALRDILSDSRTSRTRIFTGATGRKRVFPAILVVMLAIFGSFYLWKTLSNKSSEKRESSLIFAPIDSIAVLPLENLSGDPEQDYFVDGITEAIIMNLAKIKALKVISRTSSMRYKGTDKTLPQIARELNVKGVVEGSVILVGDQVRVTAQLIHAASDTHLWADSYTRDLKDILSLQNEIALAITQEIKIAVTPKEKSQLVSTRLVNPDAYDAYLMGEYYKRNWTIANREKALEYFKQAIAIDPNYARAYTGLAETYIFLGFFNHLSPKDAFPKAKQLVVQAMELDDTLAEAYRALGAIALYYDWDWVKAEKSLQRANELNPSDPGPHIFYSWYLCAMRRFTEGIAEAKRAREVDPLSLSANLAYGQLFYYARRYDDAIQQWLVTVELEPNDPWAHGMLAWAYAQKGMHDKAVSEYQDALRYSGCTPEKIVAYGQAYASGGREGALQWIIENLGEEAAGLYAPMPGLVHVAVMYATLGEKDKAFQILEKCYKNRNSGLPFLSAIPDLDPLRNDPRFDDLLRRVGFEPSRAAGFSPRKRAAGDAPAGDDKIKLAVLPFDDMSPDPQEWFSDGMTGELIATLGKIKSLGVISRTSVMQYKNTTKSLPQIARELNINKVIEGTVMRVGDRIRITVQLIDAFTEKQLWSNSYEHDAHDILALQNEIVQAITNEVKANLTPEEQTSLTRARTVNPEARDAYLKGRYFWNKRTTDGLTKGLSFFQEAVELDPTYAIAYAGVADSYNMLGEYGVLPAKDAFPKAAAAARQAIKIDENCAEAHTSLANVMLDYEWDFEGAEREFKRAIELNANYSTARQWYAEYLDYMGKPEDALKQIRVAKILDPISLIINTTEGWILIANGRYKQAIEQLQKTLELNQNFAPAIKILGRAYLKLSMHDKAIAEFQKANHLSGGGPSSYLGLAYAVTGKRDEALKILEELKEIARGTYYIAWINAGLGRKDEAFAALEKVFELRSHYMTYLLTDSRLDSLRDDPRFDDLLRRIGFEVEEKPDATDTNKSQSNAKPPADKTTDEKIMLAVLPFKNLGLAEDEYFADGISDEIRSRLASVRKLGVISRSSAFQYKDTDKSIRQIGAELGVDYLIDGTIRWDKRGGGAGRVRITPELIRISDDLSLWSKSYNRVLEDIFEVQSDIASRVIENLKITLLEPERQAIEVIPTENLDAYQAYLRGEHYAERPDFAEEDFQLAIQMFERAVSLDPDFALAYAQLSTFHSNMYHWGYDPTETRIALAKTAVNKAIKLQPNLPEAYLALGWYYYFCHREYERALEALNMAKKNLPNNSRILLAIGAIRRRQGRMEGALDNMKRAFDLSPLSADTPSIIAETYILMRRYPQAERWYDRSISLAPEQNLAYHWKASIYWLWDGNIKKARATLEEMPRKSTPYSIVSWFLQKLFERNFQAALDRISTTTIDPLVAHEWFIPKSQLAGFVHQLMGDSERAHDAYDSARILLEEEIIKRPDDHRVHSSLGIVYAGLSRKVAAIREGKRGVELVPVSKDALLGPYRVEDLAFIYTLVGEYDAALDKIEYLLSIPSNTMSVPMLRLNPRWDPLRDHPRYKEIIRRYELKP